MEEFGEWGGVEEMTDVLTDTVAFLEGGGASPTNTWGKYSRPRVQEMQKGGGAWYV